MGNWEYKLIHNTNQSRNGSPTKITPQTAEVNMRRESASDLAQGLSMEVSVSVTVWTMSLTLSTLSVSADGVWRLFAIQHKTARFNLAIEHQHIFDDWIIIVQWAPRDLDQHKYIWHQDVWHKAPQDYHIVSTLKYRGGRTGAWLL